MEANDRITRHLMLALLISIGAETAAIARVIDDFDTGQLNLLGANATAQQVQAGLDSSHVVGGRRFISFRSFADPPSTLTLADESGTLAVGPGDCCTYLTLRYGEENNPLNLNLLEDGSDRFVIEFAALSSEIPDSVPRFLVQDTNGNAAVFGGSSAPIQPAATLNMIVPFSDFPHVDFSSVRLIELSVSRYGGGTGRAGQSFSLNHIITVPEPSSVAAIACAFLSAIIARRRYAVVKLG